MKTKFKITVGFIPVICILVAFALAFQEPDETLPEKVSKLGEYTGYTQLKYDGWVRTSIYIPVRDGTKLAADIFRPAKTGIPIDEPMPVIWTHDRYRRAHVLEDGTMRTKLDSRWLQTVLKHGYVIAAVDARGSGASFGNRRGPFTPEESLDSYDIIEWLASQSWCNGNVGMFGRSYLAITQYMAASTSPPHLKAIFPEMALFDAYSFVYPGGVFHNDFLTKWSYLVREMDNDMSVTPVDEDQNRIMLKEAMEDHQTNTYALEIVISKPYRDSPGKGNDLTISTLNPASYLQEIKESGVPIYHFVGWYDIYPRDAILWFKNLDNPQRIVIGPWHHSAGEASFLAAEHLRWYDYWLKGIDNGVMDDDPIHYYTMGAPKGSEWRTAQEWPLPQERSTLCYFHEGKSQSVNSSNDGFLKNQPPLNPSGKDGLTVNYSTTSGTETRWVNGYGGNFNYPDMTVNDEKGLTYTTAPLCSDIEVTGHPIIHLWITSTHKDGDFFAYLEEVDENDYSHYISEGTLRSSHRVITSPPYNNAGIPYHRSYAGDISPLPKEPAELVFDLLPTSNIFDEGHRIRVTITCMDKDNALTPEISPPPVVSILRNSNFSSYISLPIIPKAKGWKTTVMIITFALVLIIVMLIVFFAWMRGG